MKLKKIPINTFYLNKKCQKNFNMVKETRGRCKELWLRD